MPRPFASFEHSESGTEHGKDEEAVPFQDVKNARLVSWPIGFSLMMETAVVENYIEAGTRKGKREDVGQAEGDVFYLCGPGEGPGALQGQRLVIDPDGPEAGLSGSYRMTTLAAAEIEQFAAGDPMRQPCQIRKGKRGRLVDSPSVLTVTIGCAEIAAISFVRR